MFCLFYVKKNGGFYSPKNNKNLGAALFIFLQVLIKKVFGLVWGIILPNTNCHPERERRISGVIL